MSNVAAQEYIAQLIAENASLRERVKHLELNPPKRKQKLGKEARQERSAQAKANYERGGCWYWRTEEYKKMSKNQLVAYHKEFPNAAIGPKARKLGIVSK
jgi:hypothetical protein